MILEILPVFDLFLLRREFFANDFDRVAAQQEPEWSFFRFDNLDQHTRARAGSPGCVPSDLSFSLRRGPTVSA